MRRSACWVMKLIVVEDGFASNGPHIQLLKHLDMRFWETRPNGKKQRFSWVTNMKMSGQVITEAASPGMCTRIEVVDPPYIAPYEDPGEHDDRGLV